ncbi:MAG: ABC transporter substrate-binding protein [Pigmentiphaga sp.]|nr:ABC transporter substrate-binding protein [Pigmentiphaga sp.]
MDAVDKQGLADMMNARTPAPLSLPPLRALGQSWLAACLILLALGVHGSSLAQAPQPNDPPNVLVEKATSQALARVREDQSLREGKTGSVNKAVDELILPYVNFEKTTRLAVGRNWRDATPEQRERLTQAFRSMLIRTYSGAISNITPAAKVEMLPYRYADDATDVVVRTRVSDGAREPIPVDYRLEKLDSGWKIYDLNVLGVWFIENYRNQFNGVIQKDGIEGLIRSLETRNTELPVQTKQ